MVKTQAQGSNLVSGYSLYVTLVHRAGRRGVSPGTSVSSPFHSTHNAKSPQGGSHCLVNKPINQ